MRHLLTILLLLTINIGYSQDSINSSKGKPIPKSTTPIEKPASSVKKDSVITAYVYYLTPNDQLALLEIYKHLGTTNMSVIYYKEFERIFSNARVLKQPK